MKTILLLIPALTLLVGAVWGEPAGAVASPDAKPNCCQRAEARGQTCRKMCCKDAAKENRVCDHCIKIKPPKAKGRRGSAKTGGLPPATEARKAWGDGEVTTETVGGSPEREER